VHFAIGNFIQDALSGADIIALGDGTEVRSYLDQRDLTVWLTTLLDRGVAGEVYNVGSDREITLSSLANLIRDRLAPGKVVRILDDASASRQRSRYIPCIQKARERLGLEVTVNLSDARDFAAGSHEKK
jgi:dTDP-glucose 4,6-dehydratase